VDLGFFSPLVAGLIFLAIGLVGLVTGRVLAGYIHREPFLVRRDSPVAFWLGVVLWVGGGVFLLALAFYHAARV
jgi:hypothetical protein